jgi:ribose transport system permease protein
MENTANRREDEVFCISCGATIRKEAVICPKCGIKQKSINSQLNVGVKTPIGQFIRIGILFALLIFLVVIASIMSSGMFINLINLRNIMRQFVPMLIIGISILVVMSSGGIDLSIGSLVGLTSIIVGTFNGSFTGTLCAVLVGLLFGLINGIMAVKTPVKAFIVTITTMTLIRGIALTVSNGNPKQFQVDSEYFPIQVFLALLIVGFSFFLLFRKHGIIDNGKITVSSSNDNVSIVYYLLSAFSAVVVGIFLSFRLRTGVPMAGNGYEVDAIIIAILGGAVCGYAAINLISTIIAALLMVMLTNFFTLSGVSIFVQNILKNGCIIYCFCTYYCKGGYDPKRKKGHNNQQCHK